VSKKNLKIISHPADTGIEVKAKNLKELFKLALTGLNATIFERPELVKVIEEKKIEIKGEDPKELLVNFLTEVLIYLDSERFIVREVEFKNICEKKLEAVLRGGEVDLDKMGFITEIKAITYHQLKVEKREGEWFARVIFDI